jgi:hypothetical protein
MVYISHCGSTTGRSRSNDKKLVNTNYVVNISEKTSESGSSSRQIEPAIMMSIMMIQVLRY